MVPPPPPAYPYAHRLLAAVVLAAAISVAAILVLPGATAVPYAPAPLVTQPPPRAKVFGLL